MVLFLSCLCMADEAFAGCDVTATNINFGTYNVFNAIPLVTTGTITVTCSLLPLLTNVNISIGPSTNSGGFNPRQVKHSSKPDRLNYNLFINSLMTTIWGDGTNGTDTVTCRVIVGQPCIQTVYAQVPALQDVSAGSYSDTVVITITF